MALLRTHARTLLTTVAATLALAALARPVAAQTEPAAGPAPAPPPAAAPEELPPPPPPPSYAGNECTPACRAGFLCQQGQCVSACNPPCAEGEQCNAQGECTAAGSSSASLAPSFPEPEELQAPPPRDGVEQHDGFFLRLALGFGGGAAGLDLQDVDVKTELSGGGGSFSFDIGGAPVDNLIIHLRISDFVLVDPTVKLTGAGVSGSGELNGSFGSNFFGLGLTYYFMPINLYLTAALGAGWLTIDVDGDNEDGRATDVGFGFNFDVGKEWWVSDNWGLGLAGRFALVSGTDTNDADVKTDFAMAAFTLMFSATYQ